MAFVVIMIALVHLPFELAALNGTTTDVCGFEQRCTRKMSDLEHRKKSCCQQCECTDVCNEKGTCCADKDGRYSDDNVTKQECLPAFYIPKGKRATIFQYSSYFVRTRCPETFADVEIKEKCDSDREPETLDDVTFVSSEDGNVVYKNRFCGLCHGEHNLVPWETLITQGCMKEIYHEQDNMSVEAVLKTLLTKCEILYSRPDITPVGSVLCYEDSNVVSECNKTGQWKIYDHRLINLCRDPPESVYYFDQTQRQVIIFSNIYCYLCNGHSFTVPETCNFQELETVRSASLLALIDSDRWLTGKHKSRETKKGTKGSKSCEPGMIFDTFLGVCKKVYCPMMTIAVEKECLQIIKGYSYGVDLQLVLGEEIDRLDVDQNDISHLYDLTQELLKFDKCELCSGIIYVPRDHVRATVSEIYVKLDLTPTQDCERDYVLSTVAAFETSNITASMKVGQKVTQFVGYVRERWKWETSHWDLISRTSSGMCRTIYSDRRSNCPRIKLTSNEYNSVLQTHPRANELLFSSNSGDLNHTVYVCLDNYFEKPRGVGVAKHISHVTLIATLFAAACVSFKGPVTF